jgi:hypothetical protein
MVNNNVVGATGAAVGCWLLAVGFAARCTVFTLDGRTQSAAKPTANSQQLLPSY